MPAPSTGQSPEPPSWSEWKAQHQQKPWYQRYPLAVEWLLEQVNDRLHRWAFVEFLEHVGKFTVLIAVIVWVLEAAAMPVVEPQSAGAARMALQAASLRGAS